MRRTLPSSWRARSLFFRTISSAWSHGTSSRTTVKEPCTFGSSTTFRPLISWIRRKKSFRSTSFKFTEIGSPVYFGPRVAGVCVIWAFCSAARFTAGCEAAPCCSDALGFIATSSEAGLSANFAAASSAFTEGSTVGWRPSSRLWPCRKVRRTRNPSETPLSWLQLPPASFSVNRGAGHNDCWLRDDRSRSHHQLRCRRLGRSLRLSFR